MVQLTRGKNVSIDTYDCEYKEMTGDGVETDFAMLNAAIETDVEYTRAYADNIEVIPTSVTNAALTALTGTSITMTTGSTAVTGVGSAFTTQLNPGNQIYLDGQTDKLGEVLSIESDTALTLKAIYAGTTGTTTGKKLAAATIKLPSAPEDGAPITFIMPITKNGAYSVAQGIQWSVTSSNQEIPELGNEGVQEEVLEKNLRLNASWAQASNHDLMTKLLANAVADTYMVLAEKYKATSPVSYRIFKECKVDDFGQGVTAGGVSMESCSFTSRFPIVIKTA